MHTTVTVCLGAGPMISGSAVPTTAAAIEFGNVRDGHHPGMRAAQPRSLFLLGWGHWSSMGVGRTSPFAGAAGPG